MRTRKLDPLEIRVVGALMEKEQTTPDYYPLTFKALLAACNQKSGREPVMAVDGPELEAALERLRQDVIVWRSDATRVTRWQHSLDRRWDLDAPAKAVMTLLLLRGPQTPGELRGRSERLHAFETVAEVEAVLERLAGGFDALVRELPRRPGQRESRWVHVVGTEDASTAATETESAAAATTTETGTGVATAGAPVDPGAAPEALAERLATLEAKVEILSEELHALRVRLGDAD